MKRALIIHNPSAGNAGHSREELIQVVRKAGYNAQYVAVEEEADWKQIKPGNEAVVFVVGGDGTVKKIAQKLLDNTPERRTPIHLLPLGTANNIARTLQISTVLERHAINVDRNTKSFDCGMVTGLPGEKFFIESAGFGIFPELILEMQDTDIEAGPLQELNLALEVLLKIIKRYKPQKATIKADGLTVTGSFLLVEIMNIRFLGPNIQLAPAADPGDGFLDLVLIPANRKARLEEYLAELINGSDNLAGLEGFIKTMRVQKVQITWNGHKVHIDDKLLTEYSCDRLELEVVPGALEFFQNV